MIKSHKHAELIAQYAQDASETDKPWERWEYKCVEGIWSPCSAHGHVTFHEGWEYRRKQQLKPVDLSVLIDSGIDCVGGGGTIGKLTAIHGHSDGNVCYEFDGVLNTDQCRPRMSHWHNWQGRECPLPEGGDG